VYLREIADIAYRVVAEMMYISPHKHSLIQRTLIVVLYAATKRDIAAGSLALAHKDRLACINGWLASIILN
jgi:hypothetical protein